MGGNFYDLGDAIILLANLAGQTFTCISTNLLFSDVVFLVIEIMEFA